MLKDIYSPLEIDDQWDQRAPVHENTVATELPPTATQPEAPSGSSGTAQPEGAVATMEPAHMDLPVTPTGTSTEVAPPTDGMGIDTSSTQSPAIEGSVPVNPDGATETAPSADAVNPTDPAAEVPGMQNIGVMTIPTNPDTDTATDITPEGDTTQVTGEENVFHPSDSETSAEAVSPDTATPTTMEESTDTETATAVTPEEDTAPVEPTPEENNDDTAASMLGTSTDETPSDPALEDAEVSGESGEPSSVMPIVEVKPDAVEDGEKEAVEKIVQEPIGDDDKGKITTSDADQSPISPETEMPQDTNGDNEVAAEVSRGMEKVRKAIDAELEALANRKTRLEESLAKHEQERKDADDRATATQAQIDQVEAAISELESKK